MKSYKPKLITYKQQNNPKTKKNKRNRRGFAASSNAHDHQLFQILQVSTNRFLCNISSIRVTFHPIFNKFTFTLKNNEHMSTSHYHIGWIFHQVFVSWSLDWCFHRMGFFFTCLQVNCLFFALALFVTLSYISLLVHVNFFVCFGKKYYILLGFTHINGENFRRLKNLNIDTWITFFFP